MKGYLAFKSSLCVFLMMAVGSANAVCISIDRYVAPKVNATHGNYIVCVYEIPYCPCEITLFDNFL